MQIKLSRLICINTSLLLLLITAGVSSAVPTITTIGDKEVTGEQLTFSVTENEQLILTVYATDTNRYATIRYSAADLPSGATFNPYTHTFSWTPAVGLAGDYNVKFIAESYSYYSYGSDSEIVTITVRANVDKSELIAAIADANKKVDDAVAGTGQGQYPQAAIDEFEAAIDIAQEVVDDEDATQTEVDDVLSNLESAEDDFDASVITIDKSELAAAIDNANEKIDYAVAGTDVGQYPQAAIDEFEAVIDTAQEVADDADATQTEVDNALSNLETAEDDFDASKIKSIDKTELITAIAVAKIKLASAVSGTDFGQYPQASIDEFEVAIDVAQEVVDDADATQTDVYEALSDLEAAEDDFDASKVTSIDKSELTTAIAVAKIKTDTAVAGTDIGQYPQAAIDEFKAAIDKAQEVADDTGAIQAEVNKALTDLQSAEETFDSSKITNGGSNEFAPVTNLQDSAVGSTWIRWTWTNPTDSRFSHVIVYIDGSFATMTSNNYYELTGLVGGTTHSIGIKTVDIEGNVGSEMVVDSATTVNANPEIITLTGVNITTTSITVVWESSNDTSSVIISRNNNILGTVNGSISYIDSRLEAGTTYNYTLVPYANYGFEGKAVTISLTTKSSSKSGGGGGSGSSSSKKSSSSGGGGGAGSVEDFSNLATKDVDTQYLKINENVSYEFSKEGNPVQSIRFYSLKNSGEKTSTIEVLNNRSKLVNSSPEGFVYNYVNIWVGKAGFATSANIKDASIQFKVNNSWLEDLDVSPAEVKLQRYNGTAWEVLPTTLNSSNVSYTVFEAKTPGFSPFAITAQKTYSSTINEGDQKDIAQAAEQPIRETKAERSTVWIYIMINVVAILFAFGYKYFRKGHLN